MATEEQTTGLKTRHVFLDTEVYRRYGHNLKHKVLQALLKLTKDHVCTLHITDITLQEIERQITESAREMVQNVNKGNRQLRNWFAVWAVRYSKTPAIADDLDPADLADMALREFRYALTVDWSPTRHDALNVPARDIFNVYFRREPPFDSRDSKEFPDAFVVMALNRWCEQSQQKMYVVTKDKAVLRAVGQTKTLIPVPTLEDYLALRVESPEIINKVERILESSAWDIVEQRVRDDAGHLGTVYDGDLHDGEVIEHELGSGRVELLEFDVISASSDRIEVVAKVRAPVQFEVQYLDTTSAMWDSEDKEYIGGETEVHTFEDQVVLSLLIVIDCESGTIDDVDILTRDIYLHEPYEDYR
jgi:hypothetical protein